MPVCVEQYLYWDSTYNMYTLGIYIYIALVRLCALLGYKKAKQKLAGHERIYATLKEKLQPDARYLWFHASSVGEFEQGRPFMELLRSKHPEYRVVLTFFSPSGYEAAKKYQNADVVCYIPFDTPANADIFLEWVQPQMAFFIKNDIWKNFLAALHGRGIPTYSISSSFNKSQVFFKPWGIFCRRALRYFTRLFVRDPESKELLNSIDVTNVTVVGDARFDRIVKINSMVRQLPLVESFVDGGKNIFVAGNAFSLDDEVVAPYFNSTSGWKVIIAPSSIDELRLKEIEAAFAGHCVRYSQTTMDEARIADCLIIDCIGLLSSLYRYGDVAYVGGAFDYGVYNLLEAAVCEVPVIFGPYKKVDEDAEKLKACGGGFEVASSMEFCEVMQSLTNNPSRLQRAAAASGKFVTENSGVAQKILSTIKF